MLDMQEVTGSSPVSPTITNRKSEKRILKILNITNDNLMIGRKSQRMRNEHGKAGRRFLIFVVIVGLAAWVLFSLMPTWFKAMQLKDHLKNLASYAGSYPFTQDPVMADSMARAVVDAGIPGLEKLNKDYFLSKIQRTQGSLLVQVHFERDNELLGTSVKLKHWVFDWDIDQHSVGP